MKDSIAIAILLLMLWAVYVWLEPESLGQWLNRFEHGRTGSVGADQ